MDRGSAGERRWYHTIELPDGSVTPGYTDTRAARAEVQWPAALAGGRCLDVGTFDGFWAFEMERLGAREVVALDIDDPLKFDWPYDWRASGPALMAADGRLDGKCFDHAASALGSSVTRVCSSVYELDPAEHGRFDVVFCGALLLHLQDPVRALEAIRDVCAGQLVLLEHLDPVLEVLAPGVAAARVAPEGDQWWRANSAGMVALLQRSGFDVAWVGRRVLVPHGPGWPNHRSPIDSLAARRLRGRGGLHRGFVARPRTPDGAVAADAVAADAVPLTGAEDPAPVPR